MRIQASNPTATDTDSGDASGSLRRAAFSGARWGGLASIVEQLGTVASTVVLARLLTPADFGIVTAATVAVGLFEVFTRLGFGAALVNRKTIDDRVASSTFWLALAVGLVVSGLVAFASPLLARAVGKPQAAPFIAVAGLVIAMGQVSRVSGALLARGLRFKAIYMTDIASIIAYSGTAIVLVVTTNLGPWAIIIGRVVGSFVLMVTRFVVGDWFPRLMFDGASIRDDLRFNLAFITNHLMAYGAKNADYWMLGQTASSAALGSYYVAYVLPSILRQRMTWLTGEILFPVLSRVRDEPDRMRRAYAEVMQFLSFLAFPALLGISLLSEPIVYVFFGPKWLAAVTPLSIVAVAAAIETVTQVASTIFVSQGTPGRSAIVNTIRLIALSVGLAVAAAVGGLESVALAVLVSTLVAFVVSQRILIRTIGATWTFLPKVLWPVLLPTGLMLIVVASRQTILPPSISPILDLGFSATIGGISYLAIGLLLFGSDYKRLTRQVRQFLQPQATSARRDPA